MPKLVCPASCFCCPSVCHCRAVSIAAGLKKSGPYLLLFPVPILLLQGCVHCCGAKEEQRAQAERFPGGTGEGGEWRWVVGDVHVESREDGEGMGPVVVVVVVVGERVYVLRGSAVS
jgi:hypothetical protein